MDHAEARAWLDDAFFEPGLLAQLDDPVGSPSDTADHELSAVREHLGACADCAAYLQSLWRTALTLDLAMGPSPEAKARVLEIVQSVGRRRRAVGPQPESFGRPTIPTGAVARWRQVFSPRLAAAMVVVALLGGMAGGLWGLSAQRTSATDERLVAAVAMLGDLTSDPGTKDAALHDASGQVSGAAFVSPASGRIAVFTGPLGAGGAEEWSCYLVRGGHMTELGPMNVSGSVSYWAGWLRGVPDAGQPGDRLTIAMDEQSEPALVGDF